MRGGPDVCAVSSSRLLFVPCLLQGSCGIKEGSTHKDMVYSCVSVFLLCLGVKSAAVLMFFPSDFLRNNVQGLVVGWKKKSQHPCSQKSPTPTVPNNFQNVLHCWRGSSDRMRGATYWWWTAKLRIWGEISWCGGSPTQLRVP